ncbi:Lipoprotein associated domain [Mycoplasmopsis californica]|uniref:Lipoprotein 17-related variable surface protein n=1 Tax=Mycoplasmopsis equigenitalium TaxID=114883 RepID=A0ABY5J0E4_9BACT|nr:lipoprotein 17-related variable surface protein [Mycoplasmopsis equigenitalium]UUD36694.1 lipoprotein 17-related variable surface protein [Mycoplasmopsis equigenitalium]VEU69344.1 Lipoprotein associated domain [Mycoplasmopsis californica]
MNKNKLLLGLGITFTLATTATIVTYGVLQHKKQIVNNNSNQSTPEPAPSPVPVPAPTPTPEPESTAELNALSAYIKEVENEINLKYIWRFDNPTVVNIDWIPKGVNAAPRELVEKYKEALANAKKITDNSKANEAKTTLENALNNMKAEFIPGKRSVNLDSIIWMKEENITPFWYLQKELDSNNILVVDLDIIDPDKINTSMTGIPKKNYDEYEAFFLKVIASNNEQEVTDINLLYEYLLNKIYYAQVYGNNDYIEPFKYGVPIAGEGDERDVNAELAFYQDGAWLNHKEYPGLAETKKSFVRKELLEAAHGPLNRFFNTYGTNFASEVLGYNNDEGTVKVKVTISKGNVTKSKEITIGGYLDKKQIEKNKAFADTITKREFKLNEQAEIGNSRASSVAKTQIWFDTFVHEHSGSSELHKYILDNNISYTSTYSVNPKDVKVDDINGKLSFKFHLYPKTRDAWADIEITITGFMTNEETVAETIKMIQEKQFTTNSSTSKASEVTYTDLQGLENHGITELKSIMEKNEGVMISIVPNSDVNDDTKGTKKITLKIICDEATQNYEITINGYKI